MKNINIVIVDYGIGNLYSIINLLSSLDYYVKVSSCHSDIINADFVILPGVGNFKFAMNNINKNNIDLAILERINLKKPLLGICLGMHLFFKSSQEAEGLEGLGFFSGSISKIPNTNAKVPHIGWHDIDNFYMKSGRESKKITFKQIRYYFIHSYYLYKYKNIDCRLMINYFGIKIPAIIQSGCITGIQFHPEISGKSGIEFYKKYFS